METIKTDYSPCVRYLRQECGADPAVKAMPPALRAAEIFRRILLGVPIGTIAGERLAGDYGLMFADAEFRKRVATLDPPLGVQSWLDAIMQRNHCFTGFTPAHTTVGYDALVTRGLNGIIAELEAQRLWPDTKPTEQEYLEAEIRTLRTICDWSARFAALGYDACARVPAEPPRSLLEALQAIWLVHTCVGIAENSDASLSLGRIDQYLFPFYRADRDRGVAEEDLAAVVTDFFFKLNRYGDASGALNLGGVDAEGRDLFNDLTRLFIRVAAKLQMTAPILAAHIHPGLRREDFDLLTTPELFRLGQPSFYGEFPCRKALQRRGVPETDLHRWAANSCMGLMMPGEEFSDMWGVVFTFLLPLELAVNHGRPFKGDLLFPLNTTSPAHYQNAAAILDTTVAYADELLSLLIPQHRQVSANEGAGNPDPLVSALLHGGTPGRDRILGGTRYHTINVDGFALVNAADALTAIEQLVFQRKSHTLPELIAAARNNYEGQEALRLELLASPKYGNGNAVADRTVKQLAASFAAIIRKYSDADITSDMTYMPSFHTLNFHVGLGAGWGASLDGRRAGEPFAKNVGPMQGRNHHGLTALLSSAARVEQEYFYGGQALDLHIDADLIKNAADRAKFQAAVQTYFQLGGLQIQVNGVNVDSLKQAMIEPEKYGDLTVRIGGYSARFVSLLPDIQRDMITRFEHHA